MTFNICQNIFEESLKDDDEDAGNVEDEAAADHVELNGEDGEVRRHAHVSHHIWSESSFE